MLQKNASNKHQWTRCVVHQAGRIRQKRWKIARGKNGGVKKNGMPFIGWNNDIMNHVYVY
jgi:hypothetical protein